MKTAIAILEEALNIHTTNGPINLDEGNVWQSNLDNLSAESIRKALSILKTSSSYDPFPVPKPMPQEAVNALLRGRIEQQDIYIAQLEERAKSAREYKFAEGFDAAKRKSIIALKRVSKRIGTAGFYIQRGVAIDAIDILEI